MSLKKRKIGFYDLKFKPFTRGDSYVSIDPFLQTLRRICDLSRENRKKEVTGSNKFYFLDSYDEKKLKEKQLCHLIFKSATYMHNPPLIHHDTLTERNNPKELLEGESEKTHITLKLEHHSILCLFEERKAGITFLQLIRYFQRFNYEFFDRDDQNKVIIEYSPLAGRNFIEELLNLDRIAFGEMYIDVSAFDSEIFEFSGRTDIRQISTLTIKASPGRDMKRTAKELHRYFQKEGKIKRLRIKGFKGNSPVLLDTDFLRKIEEINVKIDDTTGIVNSNEIFKELENLDC